MLDLMAIDDQWYVVEFEDEEGNPGYTEKIYNLDVARQLLKYHLERGVKAKLYYSIELSQEIE